MSEEQNSKKKNYTFLTRWGTKNFSWVYVDAKIKSSKHGNERVSCRSRQQEDEGW